MKEYYNFDPCLQEWNTTIFRNGHNMFDANEFVIRLFSVYDIKTQTELGKCLGVSQDLISNWKRGKALPTLEMLLKIVAKKGVTWDWLLEGIEPKYRNRS